MPFSSIRKTSSSSFSFFLPLILLHFLLLLLLLHPLLLCLFLLTGLLRASFLLFLRSKKLSKVAEVKKNGCLRSYVRGRIGRGQDRILFRCKSSLTRSVKRARSSYSVIALHRDRPMCCVGLGTSVRAHWRIGVLVCVGVCVRVCVHARTMVPVVADLRGCPGSCPALARYTIIFLLVCALVFLPRTTSLLLPFFQRVTSLDVTLISTLFALAPSLSPISDSRASILVHSFYTFTTLQENRGRFSKYHPSSGKYSWKTKIGGFHFCRRHDRSKVSLFKDVTRTSLYFLRSWPDNLAKFARRTRVSYARSNGSDVGVMRASKHNARHGFLNRTLSICTVISLQVCEHYICTLYSYKNIYIL